jgi:hypothetical protein
MRRIIGCFAISGCAGVCFTSAVVLGQVGGQAALPASVADRAPAAVQVKKEAGKAAGVRTNGRSPFDLEHEPAKNVAVRPTTTTTTVVTVQKAAVGRKTLPNKAALQPGQANRAPLVQQFTNQGRPMLRAELIFARNVCQLNREELIKLNRDAQKMLSEVVEKLVDSQFQPRARVQVKGGMHVQNGVDAQNLLQDGVASVMKKNLSADQWSRYEAEMQKRNANRKITTIRYFVDAIDRELYLTPVQCDQLESTLKENWDYAWAMYLENHLFGNKYYPITIDPLVTPLLTDAQKKVWAGVQKVGVYWGFAGSLAGFVNDPDALEVELGERAEPGEEANQKVGGAVRFERGFERGVERGAIINFRKGAGGTVTGTVKTKAGAEKAKAKRVVPDNVEKAGKMGQ